MSLSQFNRELLTDMLYEYNKGLQKAIEQHLVLTNKLLSHKTRFHRANEQGKTTTNIITLIYQLMY